MGGACCAAQAAPTGVVDVELPGKRKFIIDQGCLLRRLEESCTNTPGTVVVSAPQDFHGIRVAFHEEKAGALYASEMTDDELDALKAESFIVSKWAVFFHSIATCVIRGNLNMHVSDAVYATVAITVGNDPSGEPFAFNLPFRDSPNKAADMMKFVLIPLARRMQMRRVGLSVNAKEKELRRTKTECEKTIRNAARLKHEDTIAELTPKVKELQRKAAETLALTRQGGEQLRIIERKYAVMCRSMNPIHEMDRRYEEGGARPFLHLPQATQHTPKENEVNQVICSLIRSGFVSTSESSGTCPPYALKAMQLLSRVTDWDFSVFDLEAATNGNALFYLTYSLLHKLDLVRHFGIDDATLRRFLAAVQAGYHPNPYHNSTHAADVAHVMYFILTKGGLSEKCHLSCEQLLAAILAAAIHDYDHPGFNNNFHVKTNTHLATLYNDRSVLENHHLACVFEMLRRPKYNIFAPLTDVQWREIRETMVEMVLATDMALHPRSMSIMAQKKACESPDWTKKDDIHLALSMALKWADINQTSRPNFLYQQWFRCIVEEFYNQGDCEAELGMAVSPFMDRRQPHDFSQGQISFIGIIGHPLFETVSELLPSMNFALKFSAENKDWCVKQLQQSKEAQLV